MTENYLGVTIPRKMESLPNSWPGVATLLEVESVQSTQAYSPPLSIYSQSVLVFDRSIGFE